MTVPESSGTSRPGGSDLNAGWCGSPRSPDWSPATQPGPARTCGPTAVPAPRPSIPDLIIAATAELAGLIVLDLDKNLDITAS